MEYFTVNQENRRITPEIMSFIVRHVVPPNLGEGFLKWRIHPKMAGSKNNLPINWRSIKTEVDDSIDPNTIRLEDHHKTILAEIYNVRTAPLPGEEDAP